MAESPLCNYCQKDMSFGVSCTVTTLTINDQLYERVAVGKEHRDINEYNPETCPDCAAPGGGWHHVGCDWEECPVCGEQLLGCGCQWEPVALPSKADPAVQTEMHFEQE